MKTTQSKPTPLLGPRAEQALKTYEAEIATYLRELPRLLSEGKEGQHVLIKGADIVSTWKTDAEAIRAGREKFGLDPIFVKKIDGRDIERFSLLRDVQGTRRAHDPRPITGDGVLVNDT